MRLGFSIAAFLEPDVLLVDEVLSVGDANFQQKCLKRIGEIVRAGTTLLYVSHDLASVEASCEKSVWLADAVVRASGPTKEVVTMYRAAVEQNADPGGHSNRGHRAGAQVRDRGGRRWPDSARSVEVEVRLTLNCARSPSTPTSSSGLPGTRVPHVRRPTTAGPFPAGDFEITCRLHHLPLPKGHYSLWPAITGHLEAGRGSRYLPWRPVISFDA